MLPLCKVSILFFSPHFGLVLVMCPLWWVCSHLSFSPSCTSKKKKGRIVQHLFFQFQFYTVPGEFCIWSDNSFRKCLCVVLFAFSLFTWVHLVIFHRCLMFANHTLVRITVKKNPFKTSSIRQSNAINQKDVTFMWDHSCAEREACLTLTNTHTRVALIAEWILWCVWTRCVPSLGVVPILQYAGR